VEGLQTAINALNASEFDVLRAWQPDRGSFRATEPDVLRATEPGRREALYKIGPTLSATRRESGTRRTVRVVHGDAALRALAGEAAVLYNSFGRKTRHMTFPSVLIGLRSCVTKPQATDNYLIYSAAEAIMWQSSPGIRFKFKGCPSGSSAQCRAAMGSPNKTEPWADMGHRWKA